MEESKTLADSLLGGIGLDNHYTFGMVKKFSDQLLLIAEDEIGYAMAYMMDKQGMIVEGAAATGIAAVLGNKIPHQDRALVVIISGRNVDISILPDLIKTYASH